MNDHCKCALVCIAKDEDHYIQEWVDYHLKLGFSGIYIWQNDWRCSSQFLKPNPRVFLRQLDGQFQQMNCCNLALAEIWMQYQWVAVFDVDEFLVLKCKMDISEFLGQEKYKNAPCIAVNWRIFGNSNLSKIDSWSVLSRFTLSDDKLEESSKPIINTGTFKDQVKLVFNSHSVNAIQVDPNLKFALKMYGNNPHINDNGNVEPLELFHYRNKTYAERFARCFGKLPAIPHREAIDASGSLEQFNRDFSRWNTNKVKNTMALDFFRS